MTMLSWRLELSAEEKDKVSHRGKALRALKTKLEAYMKGKNHADK